MAAHMHLCSSVQAENDNLKSELKRAGQGLGGAAAASQPRKTSFFGRSKP